MVGQGRDRLGRRASRIASAQSSIEGQRVRAAACCRTQRKEIAHGSSLVPRRRRRRCRSSRRFPPIARAQARTYTPAPATWRTFEVTTRLEIANAGAGTQAWIPVPVAQHRLAAVAGQHVVGQLRDAALYTDPVYGAKMVRATWADGEIAPVIEVVSRIRTRDRDIDWSTKSPAPGADRRRSLPISSRPRSFPRTASCAPRRRRRPRARRPTSTRRARCTTGSWTTPIASRRCAAAASATSRRMLETGNMGGKCADSTRCSSACAARRASPRATSTAFASPSRAFGYKELGAGSSDISKRAALPRGSLARRTTAGWRWTRPTSAKVMRLETPTGSRIRGTRSRRRCTARCSAAGKATGWATTSRTTSRCPARADAKVAFLMYPQAETRGERVDSLDPDTFKYKITMREIAG